MANTQESYTVNLTLSRTPLQEGKIMWQLHAGPFAIVTKWTDEYAKAQEVMISMIAGLTQLA